MNCEQGAGTGTNAGTGGCTLRVHAGGRYWARTSDLTNVNRTL